MAKWVCSVCGYVHEGDEAPEVCPVCKAPASKFTKQDENLTWAAEHVVGVAQGVSEDILEDLRANFQGECSEVGMYLAMARVAHREGYPEANLEKLMKMCLIHDLGEAFTGDIPTFEKSEKDEEKEASLLNEWMMQLPEPFVSEMQELYREMEERKTLEARIYKALDNLEALIQHNESDISTWIPLEYDLQMTYGNDKVQFSEYLTRLRDEVRNDSKKKIAESIKKSD